ncbi:S-norcoclaurine synthase 1 [Platanthera zijinensis]|uniref:S-norcoclaurine synthase 1 n=1 Tax=Platanthera zijinensis TaxID=2320716 RepID=A0AAP0BNG3_9ASPA
MYKTCKGQFSCLEIGEEEREQRRKNIPSARWERQNGRDEEKQLRSYRVQKGATEIQTKSNRSLRIGPRVILKRVKLRGREREMAEKIGLARFGGSLKVDNVQALAAHVGAEVPQRYVRREREEETVISGHEGSGDSIPVIDFARLLDSEFAEEEAARLHSACEAWGFFQIINHGIAEAVIEKLKQDITGFFKLPLEEKNKVAQRAGSLEGYGQTFVHSEEQMLDWCDILFLATSPPSFKQLRFWPTNPPSFRKTVDEYAAEVKRVSDDILKVISTNLGLESGKIFEMFKGGLQTFRFNYYPPCICPEKVLGVSQHSDVVGLTLLLQVNEQDGLQIRRNGGWITVKPLPGALIANVGDIIEILSNGRYKSIEHRAIVNNVKERITVGGFQALTIGDIVGPIPEIVNGEKPLYRSLELEEYAKMLFANKLDGKSNLERMKLSE